MRKLTPIALSFALAGGAALADSHVDTEAYGSKGYIGDAGVKGYVAAYVPQTGSHNSLIYRHRSERRGSGPLYQVPGCPPKFNGMWRGTMYCVNGRPMD